MPLQLHQIQFPVAKDSKDLKSSLYPWKGDELPNGNSCYQELKNHLYGEADVVKMTTFINMHL